MALLQQPHSSDPRAFVESLVTEVIKFCNPAQPIDDMTLMLLSRRRQRG